jgi:hypothetical protein
MIRDVRRPGRSPTEASVANRGGQFGRRDHSSRQRKWIDGARD